MASKASATSYTERELEVLRIMHRCLKSKPDVDMDKFAAESGFNGVKSARAYLHRLLKKLTGDEDMPASATPVKGDEGDEVAEDTPAAGKKKGGGRKRKTDTAEGEDADTPSKKKAIPSKRKTKTTSEGEEAELPVKKEADEDDAGEEAA